MTKASDNGSDAARGGVGGIHTLLTPDNCALILIDHSRRWPSPSSPLIGRYLPTT
jgi:hypothetical protein